jgi:RNA polymerase sigma-70 factor (ECF subfamily)
VKTVEYEKHGFISQEDYNNEEKQIKLMYKAVYQLNDIEKALILCTWKIKDAKFRNFGELPR